MKKLLFILILLFFPLIVDAQINGEVSLNVNDIKTEEKGEFIQLTFLNSIFMSELGSPKLPFIVKTYVIPTNAKVNGIRVNSSTKKRLAGRYYIYPAQASQPIGYSQMVDDFQQNNSIYNSSKAFPTDRAEILSDHHEMGYHIVTVAIYPIEYIPSNKEVYVHNVNYTIDYTLEPQQRSEGENTPQQSVYRANLAKSQICSIVENPEDVNRFAPIMTISEQSQGIYSNKDLLLKSGGVREELKPELST